MNDFNFEDYKGPYVAVPEPLWEQLEASVSERNEYFNYLLHNMKRCRSYEPDNHHNAALCPYCTPAEQKVDFYQHGYAQARRDIAARLTSSGQKALVAVIADLIAIGEDYDPKPTQRILVVHICDSCGKHSQNGLYQHYSGCEYFDRS